ncbi:MAG: MarR family winged helix-turn-helix transcriptional regulator [Solirubrobacterales bacterium]
MNELSREAWLLMSDLVLDNQRRRKVADATGISFARVRAIRRLAREPMSMKQLAALLGVDPPNVTPIIDDLEAQGLVRRKPHPDDRRAKLVELTAKGRKKAEKADEILATPPAALSDLSEKDLKTLERILAGVRDASNGQAATK